MINMGILEEESAHVESNRDINVFASPGTNLMQTAGGARCCRGNQFLVPFYTLELKRI